MKVYREIKSEVLSPINLSEKRYIQTGKRTVEVMS